MSLVARVTSATVSGVVPTSVIVDIGKYGAPCIAVLTAIENIPGLGVSGPAQGIIGGVVAVFTAILSVLKQQQVARAKAGK